MIVKRKPQQRWPRTVVRRTRASVGERKRMIVRRGSRGVQPPRNDGGGGSWRPNFHFGKGWLWGLGVVAAFALVIGGGAWLWRSPFFEVNDVEVQGTERISPETVVERSGLLGQRMFDADLATAQDELYRLPLVSSVRVERQWPDTIKIVVVERQPWGVWEQAGVRYTIDREGVVLGTIPPSPNAPVIRSSELTSLIQGDRVSYQAVDAAAEIYDRLPRQLGTTVTEVAYVAGKGVQVTTADGQVGLLGDSSSIAYKLAAWAAMSRQAQSRGINYTTIDLRFGNRPVLQ
ncbi:MAG: FtsQ-type POTRA domain-containing protein [Chloroflexi bacterium]|nr:FtsQ-type POTRA domain-containing protein [Chloroflexota bacterium]